MRWSEDFGHYLNYKYSKGAFIGIGAGDCPDLHTKDYEYPDVLLELFSFFHLFTLFVIIDHYFHLLLDVKPIPIEYVEDQHSEMEVPASEVGRNGKTMLFAVLVFLHIAKHVRAFPLVSLQNIHYYRHFDYKINEESPQYP